MNKKDLCGLFSYDPVTGVLYWRESRGRVKKGAEAGTLHREGYRVITINCRQFLAHRVIWMMMTGRWPSEEIDHINGDRSDNRLENLREVSHRKNQQNVRVHRDGRLVGATRKGVKWQSQIKYGQRNVYLGLFNTEMDAHKAYVNALNCAEREA